MSTNSQFDEHHSDDAEYHYYADLLMWEVEPEDFGSGDTLPLAVSGWMVEVW